MKKSRLVSTVMAIAMMLTLSGCRWGFASKFIQKGTFALSDDLSSARVSLVFTDRVKSDFNTDYRLKEYGSIFMLPYLEGVRKFEAGFNLNLQAMYDNGFAQMAPTLSLPNGMPLPIGDGTPLVEVEVARSVSPRSPSKILAYVDIRGLKWLGMAAIIRGMDRNFPPEIEVSQVFARDAAGQASVVGSFFGPKLDPDGAVVRSGGLALFANVKALLDARADGASGAIELKPIGEPEVRGTNAEHYRENPAQLEKAIQAAVNAL